MASNKNCKVTNLSITRDGNKIKGSWKKPSNWSTNWDWTDVEFWIDRKNVNPVSTDVWRTPNSKQRPVSYTAADRFWLKGDYWDGTDQEKAYDRNRYHPVANGKTCSEALIGVHGGWNPKGGTQRGNKVWAKYKFELPRAPSKKIEYNNQTGVFTVTVTTNEGKDQYERYDTVIRVSLRKVDGKEVQLMGWTTTRSTEWKKTFNCSSYLVGMQVGNYITLRVWAYARGMAGDNPAASKATSTDYNVVWPSAPTINSITLTGGLNSRGRICVNITTGGWGKTVKLQRRVGPTGSFSDVDGTESNQDIANLFDNYGDIFPDNGVYVYYRTKCTRENYTSYGNIVRADCIYTEIPKITATATVIAPSLSAYGDRTRIKVIMPWVDTDKNTGCELMYSDQSYFSSSTTQQYTGTDEESAVAGKTTKTVDVYGFSPGKRYYFKFRRYRNYSGDTYYSEWSKVSSILMPEATDDTCGIKAPSSNSEGTAALFTVVTNLKNALDNVGIEITYSTSKDAWTSSSETPSSHVYNNVTLTDITEDDWKKSWTKQVALTLTSLSVGTEYYMKARVFGTFNGETVYSGYSAMSTVTMQSAADDKCSVAVAPLAGGTRAKLTITVDENSSNSGTEIQWSTYENSWYSNESPSSIKADWPLDSNDQTVYLTGLLPETTYYVRARRYSDLGGNPGPWSEIVSFTTIRDTAENDRVGIVSAVPDPSGTSAEVIIGWTEDNQNIATELSWSDNQSAWTSNVSPSSMEITWDEDPISKSSDWDHTHTIQLRDLNLGTTYYLKARRKNDDESGTTYTPYSPMATVVMPTKSENVDVRCGIVLLESESDGSTVKVVIGWEGDHAGCEVTWSNDPEAWESSTPPSSFEFDWSDSEPYPGHYENAEGIEFDESITFYTRTGSGTEIDPYIYTEATDPSADDMYEYSLTSDTEIDESKTYYTRSGEGTTEEPYEYSVVSEPDAEDLSEYYERSCIYWVLMDSWANTSTCYLKGLEQGVLYYVRARSYGGGDNKTYSAYTEDKTVMPLAYPDSVVLTVPSYIIRGNPIECWWDVASELMPTEWHMHLDGHPNYSIAEGTGSLTHAILTPEQYGEGDEVHLYVEAGCGGGLTSSGVVTVSVIDIPLCEAYGPDEITEQPASGFVVYTDNPNSIVYATCYSFGCTLSAPDGDRDQIYGDSIWTSVLTPSWTETAWTETDEYSDILNAYGEAASAYQTAKTAFDATAEAQALAELTEDDPEYSEAYDAAYSTAEGIALQDANRVLVSAFDTYNSHCKFELTSDTEIVEGKDYYTRSGSGTVSDPYIYELESDPSVSELSDYYEQSIVYSFEPQLPVIDLYDGGRYWCDFAVIEKIAGVSSSISSAEFGVEYSHQAPDIDNCVILSPNYDARSVEIRLAPPEGSVETDVYDVYRMSPTGFDLIRQGLDLEASFEDYYAPFGHDELVYRIAIRTTDGDFSWLDFQYIMPIYVLRFDWNNNFVEFPWNIEVRESMSKSFEFRRHVDGSINGYWDQGVEHKGSFSTDVIRVDSWELIKQARNIGEYPGPIFVRDSYGKAMTCNVEVNEISIPNLAQVVGISFDFTHIKLADQFLPDNGSGGIFNTE